MAVVARRPEPIDEVVALIGAAGGDALGFQRSVSSERGGEDHHRARGRALRGHRYLVNSQGIQRYGTVEETSDELWTR